MKVFQLNGSAALYLTTTFATDLAGVGCDIRVACRQAIPDPDTLCGAGGARKQCRALRSAGDGKRLQAGVLEACLLQPAQHLCAIEAEPNMPHLLAILDALMLAHVDQ